MNNINRIEQTIKEKVENPEWEQLAACYDIEALAVAAEYICHNTGDPNLKGLNPQDISIPFFRMIKQKARFLSELLD